MNLTTHYIEEVLNVGPYSMEWTNKYPSKLFVKVKIAVNSHGSKQIHYRIWDTDQWEKVKAQGYYVE